jgi:ATP-dependent DNA helicase DinG
VKAPKVSSAPAGTARRLLGPGGPLSAAFPGYEERSGQLDMADAVERALAEARTLLCEAGTGTGKTLAYLVPAILSGRKVVISTATKALQEQIVAKDLPLIAEHLGLDPQAALGKGLSNYLCLRRYNELRGSAGAMEDASVRRSLPMVERWAAETETGDVAELVTLGEGDPIWREVSSSSETRIGQGCAYYEECFVTKMKRDLDEARVLVVNHALFFADLAVKMAASDRGFAGAGALPPYDAVIFDEAHELEAAATDFFGVRVSRARVEALARDADRTFVAAGLADLLSRGEGTALTRVVRDAADAFFAELAQLAQLGQLGQLGHHGPEGRVPLPADVWIGELAGAYHRLDAALEALAGYAETHNRDEAVRLVAGRAQELRAATAKVVDPKKNQVTWVEVRPRGVSVGASPIDLGDLFRARVFEPIGSVVLTSATLTTGPARAPSGDRPGASTAFGYLRSRMGLDEHLTVPVEELAVPSPFDYPSAALLYTPRDLPEVNDASFVACAADRVAELVALTGGGAFVLCTSNRSMRAFAAALRGKTPMPPLLQGDAPKQMLIRRFRSDRNAVLVATMSFWEGVDVPGHALRLVVIDKLPFAVPSDPVVAARCRALEEEGQNPFLAYSVPEAAITLKQGFGRLIRTRTDRGIVAILDRRIRTRGYGAAMLAALPPARRTDRLADVEAFWREARG